MTFFQLAGFPQPAVFWFRGDSQIEEDDRTYVRVQETAERWVNYAGFVNALNFYKRYFSLGLCLLLSHIKKMARN